MKKRPNHPSTTLDRRSIGDQVRAHHDQQARDRLAHRVRTLALSAGADAVQAEDLAAQAVVAFPARNGLASPPPGLTLETWVARRLAPPQST